MTLRHCVTKLLGANAFAPRKNTSEQEYSEKILSAKIRNHKTKVIPFLILN